MAVRHASDSSHADEFLRFDAAVDRITERSVLQRWKVLTRLWSYACGKCIRVYWRHDEPGYWLCKKDIDEMVFPRGGDDALKDVFEKLGGSEKLLLVRISVLLEMQVYDHLLGEFLSNW